MTQGLPPELDVAGERSRSRATRFKPWMVGCGIGCGVLLALMIAASIFLGGIAKRAKDPAVTWPRVRSMLPYDRQPVEVDVRAAVDLSILGLEQATLVDRRNGAQVLVLRFESEHTAEFDRLFDPDAGANKGVLTLGGVENAERAQIEIQGHAVRALRFNDPRKGGRAGVRVDLTRADGRRLLVQYELEDVEPSALDEPLQRFLDSFRVWSQP